MRNAVPVGDVIEQGPELLELGFSHSQITQAAKHLGAVSKVSPVGHLDEQCSILWGELLPLSLAVALSKCLQSSEENAGQYKKPGMRIQNGRTSPNSSKTITSVYGSLNPAKNLTFSSDQNK